MVLPFNDIYFMKKALQEAETAFDKGEVPIGAVVVVKDRIIARPLLPPPIFLVENTFTAVLYTLR